MVREEIRIRWELPPRDAIHPSVAAMLPSIRPPDRRAMSAADPETRRRRRELARRMAAEGNLPPELAGYLEDDDAESD